MSVKRTQAEFQSLLAEKNPTVELLGEYITSKTPVRCRCKVCGHEWDGNPNNLLNGHICKNCGRKVAAQNRHLAAKRSNNFADLFPHLLDEWDYEGNGNQRPEELSAGCDFVANWICPFGHHYSAKICERTKKKPLACPVCNIRNLTSFPEQAIFFYIKEHFPEAINRYKKGFGKQELDIYIPALNMGIEYDGRAWHKNAFEREMKKYEKCKELGITLVRVREVIPNDDPSFACDILLKSDYASDGFAGLDRAITKLFSILNISSDIDSKRDSLVIKQQYYSTLKSGSFAQLYPEVAAEWDYDANWGLTPEMFFPGSQDLVHWTCSKGHKYRAKIASRVYGSGCSKCAGLKKKTTEEFREEMQAKQPYILVLGEYINSKTSVLCRCLKCGHEWYPTPNTVLRNHGCSACANEKRSMYKTRYHAKKNNK